ncbi:MAG TPA: hypothetical protein VNO17_12865 [Actinomycetota bacterium]|nr:hypothetical protein [Actinomycetota bacterium]
MSVHRGVAVRAHFDRFPASLKGALVLRGEDPDPHQVVLREARVASLGGDPPRPLALPGSVVDLPPRRDVFVPFEFPLADLEPGWYVLECDLEVDGHPGTVECGQRFPIAWPRSTVRRGVVPVARSLGRGRAGVRIEQVECLADRARVRFATEGEEAPPIRVIADGTRLPVVEEEFDPDRGRGSLTTYPVLRTHASLRIEVGRGREGASVELPL